MHQLVKLVSPDHQVRIYIHQHVQKFLGSYTWSVGTNVLDCLDNGLLMENSLVALGHCSLSNSPLWSCQTVRSTVRWIVSDCRAEGCLLLGANFFNKSSPYSLLLISMIFIRPLLRSSEYSKAFFKLATAAPVHLRGFWEHSPCLSSFASLLLD